MLKNCNVGRCKDMERKYTIKDLELVREGKKKNKFLIKRDNTIKSLKEVEYFLGNWKRVFKGIKLYKMLK